ncbi:phosphodiester glycosidase family protein [bacterium]|nr:phosphodiester glycosidase family protein [bacterium]
MMIRRLCVAFVIFAVVCSAVWACESVVKVEYDRGVYHIVLDGKKAARRINFVFSEKLISNREAHVNYDSLLTVNTGFFDPKNQKTISYVKDRAGRELKADENENLLSNPVLVKNMDKLDSRAEFRVLRCGFRTRYEIVEHTAGVDEGCEIETAAQGGPMILPELRLEEEFFVLRDEQGKVVRESASVLHKCARTVFGLKGGDIHILIFTNESPVDMFEVKAFCQKLGLERAMGFDGGSSTSFNYEDLEVVSAKGSGRLLKSFMIFEK